MALQITRELPNGVTGTFYARVENIWGGKASIRYSTSYYFDESKAKPPTVLVKTAIGDSWEPGKAVAICADEDNFIPDLKSSAKHLFEQAYAHLKTRFPDAADA